MFGIVIVSHSRALARSISELAIELSGKKIPVAYAGGVEGRFDEFGTDATDILDAIDSVYSNDGVIIFSDMGSALLSSETALDLIDAEKIQNIIISSAPLVEGVLSAAVQCGIGSSLKISVSEAEESLLSKIEYLKKEGEQNNQKQEEYSDLKNSSFDKENEIIHEEISVIKKSEKYIIRNKLGLHARPAAKLIKIISESGCSTKISNTGRNKGPVNGLSMNRLSSLEIMKDDEILIEAEGKKVKLDILFQSIKKLVDDNFGESELSETGSYIDGKENVSGIESNKNESKADRYLNNKKLVILSEGIALGKAHHIESGNLNVIYEINEDTDTEIDKLHRAVEKVKSEIREYISKKDRTITDEKQMILETHLYILKDPDLIDKTVQNIKQEKYTSSYAWSLSAREIISRYDEIENEYLKTRSEDVKDITLRVLKYLDDTYSEQDYIIPEGSVIIADKLTPSQILKFDSDKIQGLLLLDSNTTSHASILAKSLGIPAIGGFKNLTEISENQLVGLDAVNGVVFISPDEKQKINLKDSREVFIRERMKMQKSSFEPVYTKDGKRIHILANISSIPEAEAAVKNGADGIGVLRSEFLFLDKSYPPEEEEQYVFYTSVFKLMEGKPVTIRTVDIGGDKIIPYMKLPKEDNPFLGLRGVRIYEDYSEMLKTHIRAILRAGFENDLKIMIPMISRYSECQKTYDMINEVHKELTENQINHIWPVEIGIMIETPASVIMANELAGISDFFSIGTNDLTQYILAAERGNSNLSEYSSPYDPAVLRAVRTAVHAAECAGIEVSLCGELGGDPSAVSLLVGLGIYTLSMNPFKIPEVKKAVRNISSNECSEKCVSILYKSVSPEDVKHFLND